jgi:hypothetical protein
VSSLGGSSEGPGGAVASSATAASSLGSILDYLSAGTRGGRGGGALRGAAIERLAEALGQFEGCFYGLSGNERRVLTMRAGLGGRRPRSRSEVAGRLNTSTGQVRRTERSALLQLDSLAQSTGCAAGGAGAAADALADGFISLAELARAPQLVAFANPGYQGLSQARFSRLGPVPDLGSPLPLSGFGDDPKSGALWALQLLAVMLLLGLVGLVRGAPALALWLRARREGLPSPTISARSPEPAPHPVHRQAAQAPPRPEGARPSRRQLHT